MIANLPVDVMVRVVPFATVNGPVTDALLLAAIVTLPVVAAKFTRKSRAMSICDSTAPVPNVPVGPSGPRTVATDPPELTDCN